MTGTVMDLILLFSFFLVSCAALSVPPDKSILQPPSSPNPLHNTNLTIFSEWPAAPFHHYYSTSHSARLVKFLAYGARTPPSNDASINEALHNIIFQILHGPALMGTNFESFRSGNVMFVMDFPEKLQLKNRDVAEDLTEVLRLMNDDYEPREVLMGQLGPAEPWLPLVANWGIIFDFS